MSAPEFAAMYELLVVGSRGSGLSDRLLGSTARALASGCPVPVLMVSAARGRNASAA